MKNPNKTPDTALAIPKMCDVKPTFLPGTLEAQELNRAHSELVDLTADFTGKFAPKAVVIGQKLLRIKKSLGHGHFQQWVEKHLDFDVRTARRYMARAKSPERTALSDLPEYATLMAPQEAPASRELKKVPTLKLFSAAASKVLQQPLESISAEDKATICRDFERLEPIAPELRAHPSIFSLTWQKKLSEAPSRWSRREVALFRQEVAKAKKILRAVEADAEFDIPASPVQAELAITMEANAI